jgi:hypothetical protein
VRNSLLHLVRLIKAGPTDLARFSTTKQPQRVHELYINNESQEIRLMLNVTGFIEIYTCVLQ